MVAPITDKGLTTTIKTFQHPLFGTIEYKVVKKHRRVQKRPYNLVLPYYFYDREVISIFGSGPTGAPGVAFDAGDELPVPLPFASIENKSYDKLRSKLYDTVQAGAAFAEYRQSLGLIADTATTLTAAVRAVRSGNIPGALKALGYQGSKTPKSVSRYWSQNWLALHFGWEPLVKDIYKSCEILNDPVKSYALERGKAYDRFAFSGLNDYGSSTGAWSVEGTAYSTQGARVRFEKPGTQFTLHQFGLDNPASIAWEVIPFSFVVDWFVNVGDFLQSLPDFAGMTLEGVYRSRKMDCVWRESRVIKPGFIPTGASSVSTRHVYTERYSQLSGISLEVKKLKPPSIIRAATAISLLVTTGLR